MKRQHEAGNNSVATTSRTAAALRSLRSQIDKLDLQIVKLVNERAHLAAEIGKVWPDLPGARQRALVAALIERIDVGRDQIDIHTYPPIGAWRAPRRSLDTLAECDG